MSWRIIVISKRAKLDLQLGKMVVRSDEITKIVLSEISTIINPNVKFYIRMICQGNGIEKALSVERA